MARRDWHGTAIDRLAPFRGEAPGSLRLQRIPRALGRRNKKHRTDGPPRNGPCDAAEHEVRHEAAIFRAENDCIRMPIAGGSEDFARRFTLSQNLSHAQVWLKLHRKSFQQRVAEFPLVVKPGRRERWRYGRH